MTGVGILRMFVRQPLLLLMALIAFLSEAGFVATLPMIPIYMAEELHAPGAFAGLVISAFALAETAFKIPAGALSDRLGRKYVMLVGLAIAAIASATMGLLPTWLPFIFVHPMVGLAAAMMWTSVTASFLDLVGEGDRATALGLDNLCYLLGIVVGAAVAFSLRHHFGTARPVFWATCAALIASFLLTACFAPRALGAPTARPKVHTTKPARESILSIALSTVVAFLRLCRSMPFFLTAALLGLIQFAVSLQIPVLPVYAHTVLKLSDREISLLILVVTAVLVLMALPLSRLGDRLPRLLVIQIALGVGACAIGVAPYLRSISVLATIGLITGSAWVMGLPAILALADDIASRGERGLTLGFVTTAQGMGFIVGPSAGAFAGAHVSKAAPFWLSAIALAIAFIVTLPLHRELALSQRQG